MMEKQGISGKTIVILISIAAIILLIFVPVYTNFNLKKYSIWYAQRMPHAQGTDPVLAMVGNNIAFINLPDDTEEKRYILDSDLVIEEKKENGEWVTKVVLRADGYVSFDYYSDGELDIMYSFNDRGELETIRSQDGIGKEVFTKEEKEEAYERAYAVIQPFIDKQFFPIINMQGTFDREYQLQFK